MTVKYENNGKIAYFNGNRFTRDERTGYYLASKPINGKRKRLHIVVWEYFNGEVPEGYNIHHKDHDKRNNAIDNLECMTKSEHLRHHGKTRPVTEEMLNHLAEAREMTKVWHASKEGREWHRQHAIESAKNRKPIKLVCTYCGKEYEAMMKNKENNFCSNNCKSAYRRKMGYDNIEKVCEHCGGTYIANKYQKTKYCNACSKSRSGWQRRCVQLGSALQPQVRS